MNGNFIVKGMIATVISINMAGCISPSGSRTDCHTVPAHIAAKKDIDYLRKETLEVYEREYGPTISWPRRIFVLNDVPIPPLSPQWMQIYGDGYTMCVPHDSLLAISSKLYSADRDKTFVALVFQVEQTGSRSTATISIERGCDIRSSLAGCANELRIRASDAGLEDSINRALDVLLAKRDDELWGMAFGNDWGKKFRDGTITIEEMMLVLAVSSLWNQSGKEISVRGYIYYVKCGTNKAWIVCTPQLSGTWQNGLLTCNMYLCDENGKNLAYIHCNGVVVEKMLQIAASIKARK